MTCLVLELDLPPCDLESVLVLWLVKVQVHWASQGWGVLLSPGTADVRSLVCQPRFPALSTGTAGGRVSWLGLGGFIYNVNVHVTKVRQLPDDV